MTAEVMTGRSSPSAAPATSVLHALVALVGGVLVGVAVWACGRGLDRVDESYVLAGVADPDASRAAGEVTFSSFALHPLYLAVGGDIARYRVVGLLIVVALSAVTMDRLTRCVDALTVTTTDGWRRHLAWIGAGATSLTAFTFGLRSLSYNSLVLLGLLVATIGVGLLLEGRDVFGGATSALGAWVVFLGKPTSALALAVVAAIALLVARRVTVRAVVAACAVLVVAATLILVAVRMTPSEAFAFLAGGLRQDQLLGGHVALLPMLGLATAPVAGLLFFGLPVAVAGALAGELAARRSPGALAVGLGFVAVASVGVVVLVVPGLADRGLGLQILPFALVLVVVGVWLVVRQAVRDRHGDPLRPARRELLCLTVFLALMPYAASVGTNSPFTEAMPHYAVFSVMATVVGLRAFGAGDPVLVVAIGVAMGVSTVMLATALLDGGPSSSLLAAETRVPVAGGTLGLPDAEARVAGELNDVVRREGITAETPVVDLTGISPGYALQLGGRPLGRESFMGIFPGAPAAAAYALAQVPCGKRSSAWVLWAPDNPWSVAGAVDLGRRVPDDYEVVGRFSPVQGPAAWRPLVIQVLRPRADVESACPT